MHYMTMLGDDLLMLLRCLFSRCSWVVCWLACRVYKTADRQWRMRGRANKKGSL